MVEPRNSYWQDFPDTYRLEQVKTIASWLAAGESGAIVGGSGTGKSNLVGFLGTRPNLVQGHLPEGSELLHLLHFDVNSLSRSKFQVLRENSG